MSGYAMQPEQANLINPFGEPLELEFLLEFATVDEIDMESAIQWWDETASPDWVGALDAPPRK